LQRTLLLAQKFVEQTEAEAEAQARSTLEEAEARARTLVADAETRARTLTEETERHLREDVARLESVRTQLAGDVETIARHLDNERNRLRAALGDMLTWVDEHVQPAASLLAQPSAPSGATPTASVSGSGTGSPPVDASTRPASESEGRGTVGQPLRPTPSGSGPSGSDPTGGSRGDATGPGERQGMMPLADPETARAGVPR
jgi:vacuolar-type H+-ATPase subunit H